MDSFGMKLIKEIEQLSALKCNIVEGSTNWGGAIIAYLDCVGPGHLPLPKMGGNPRVELMKMAAIRDYLKEDNERTQKWVDKTMREAQHER